MLHLLYHILSTVQEGKRMETDLSLSMILQHLEVSLIPWLIVMVVGGGLGYFFASYSVNGFRITSGY